MAASTNSFKGDWIISWQWDLSMAISAGLPVRQSRHVPSGPQTRAPQAQRVSASYTAPHPEMLWRLTKPKGNLSSFLLLKWAVYKLVQTQSILNVKIKYWLKVEVGRSPAWVALHVGSKLQCNFRGGDAMQQYTKAFNVIFIVFLRFVSHLGTARWDINVTNK